MTRAFPGGLIVFTIVLWPTYRDLQRSRVRDDWHEGTQTWLLRLNLAGIVVCAAGLLISLVL